MEPFSYKGGCAIDLSLHLQKELVCAIDKQPHFISNMMLLKQ